MKKSTKKPILSHADVSKAIQKFKEHGGLIKRLPDQVVLKGGMIGGKFAVYESVFDNGGGAGSTSPSVEAVAE
jgi:hypothetical protein